ncbi:hypothetical protein AOQ84DRAFT_76034 [Glonium stellatum]|uniref:Uncharacterized protein n=1 Tax=Glonium stellatum TaxID=574774 RepID=A0A8E2JR71_9PEZI|nr:hypothetical protein AOQ84DRAFT_76034 [Glonium stellatum]
MTENGPSLTAPSARCAVATPHLIPQRSPGILMPPYPEMDLPRRRAHSQAAASSLLKPVSTMMMTEAIQRSNVHRRKNRAPSRRNQHTQRNQPPKSLDATNYRVFSLIERRISDPRRCSDAAFSAALQTAYPGRSSSNAPDNKRPKGIKRTTDERPKERPGGGRIKTQDMPDWASRQLDPADHLRVNFVNCGQSC